MTRDIKYIFLDSWNCAVNSIDPNSLEKDH